MASTTVYLKYSFNLISRLFPEIKWAQRKERLFITIELADFENHKIELSPEGQLKFQ